MWDKIKKATNILWTVGERLRVVYSSSDNEEVRRRDRRQTALCVGAFAVSCLVLVIIDSYGDAFTAARSVTAKVRAFGARGGGSGGGAMPVSVVGGVAGDTAPAS